MRKLVLIIAFVYLYQGLFYTKTEVVGQFPLLYEKLVAAGIRYPAAVFAQAGHETDGFTSWSFRNCHNPWGMKVATQRPTTALGWCGNHAGYASLNDAILDYKIWQDKYLPRYEARFGSIASNEGYVEFLHYQGFAEDKKYRQKVAYFIRIVERLIPSDQLTVRGEIKTK